MPINAVNIEPAALFICLSCGKKGIWWLGFSVVSMEETEAFCIECDGKKTHKIKVWANEAVPNHRNHKLYRNKQIALSGDNIEPPFEATHLNHIDNITIKREG